MIDYKTRSQNGISQWTRSSYSARTFLLWLTKTNEQANQPHTNNANESVREAKDQSRLNPNSQSVAELLAQCYELERNVIERLGTQATDTPSVTELIPDPSSEREII